MTSRVYRTAQGKMVDIGAMLLQNETVRAVGVGTQPINARGDLIDSQNQPISSRNQQIARQYNKQISNVSNDPVQSTNRPNANVASTQAPADIPTPPEDFEDNFQKEEPIAAAPISPKKDGGLAAAIAKARSVKQEPIVTPRQAAQAASGVKKI